MKRRYSILLCVLCAGLVAGCTTIPNGGFYGDVNRVGKPGSVIGTVQVGEGMLVQTLTIDSETEINIQINEDRTDDDPLLFDNVLTIGKFSEWLGSGFTRKENIYYQKRVYDSGQDIFEVKGRKFLVTWKCDYRDARTYLVSDHYTVSVQELLPLDGAAPAEPEE